jgi:hypothetical protein
MDAYRLYRMLERRYDGELPQHLRRAALAGGARSFDAAALHADARCWDRQALIAQTKAAAQRADTTFISTWRAEALTSSACRSED